MGETVSLLSFSPKMQCWEQMTYQDCLLVPNLVMNLIRTKSVTHAQGKVTFENQLVTVQDKHGHVICVPMSGNGYPAAAIMIWNDKMAKPAISLAFTATPSHMESTHGTHGKANLWHRRLAHPQHVKVPLELVSMDVMGPLHGTMTFAYVLIIHNAYSGSHCHTSEALRSSVKVTASPTQQHSDNVFTEWVIQIIQKITRSILYDANVAKHWWPYAISQAAFIHNRLAGTMQGHVTPFELFYRKHPELCQIRHFGCIAYIILRGNTCTTCDDHVQEEPNDDATLYLPSYSHQRNSSSCSVSPNAPSYNWEWDHMMAEIEAAGEVVVDLNMIAADLEAELDATPSEGGNSSLSQDQVLWNDLETVSLLRMLGSNIMTDIYDDVSVLGPTPAETLTQPSLLAFAATCLGTQALTFGNNHLDHMAFTVTVMNGTALIASGQQMHSANGILLEPLSLNKVKMHSANGILLEPLSLNKVKMHDNWDKWQEAIISEMASMKKMDVFELADTPNDGKLIGICWVFKLKLDTQQQATWYKACLVTQGYRLHVIQLDISMAFLNRKIDKDVYVQIPPTFKMNETNGKCYRLKKALYSLKQHVPSQSTRVGTSKELWQNSEWMMHGQPQHLQPKQSILSSHERETSQVLKSRPDIAFAIGRCARFVANPLGEHLAAAKWILRYLKGTTKACVQLVFLAPTNGGKQFCGSQDQYVPVLHSNSSGAHTIASDPQHFKRTKHIDIAHFFLRDKIASQWLTIAPVQSSKNLADIMTKPLAAPMIQHLCHSFGLTTSERHAGLRGGVEGHNPVTMLMGDAKMTRSEIGDN
ncbi:hypothetical protein NDA14_003947 [Ustilago hordei]|nr:hypothetical protein NDA14_003947 [Ustilago hordei]